MVKDENVGKQDLQGILFGWSGIGREAELLFFVLVWALNVVNSRLQLEHIAILLEGICPLTPPNSWNAWKPCANLSRAMQCHARVYWQLPPHPEQDWD